MLGMCLILGRRILGRRMMGRRKRAAGLRAGVQRGQSDVLKVGVTGVACLVVLVVLVRRYAEPCDDGDGARCGAVVAGVAGALTWVAALAGTRAHVARDLARMRACNK